MHFSKKGKFFEDSNDTMTMKGKLILYVLLYKEIGRNDAEI